MMMPFWAVGLHVLLLLGAGYLIFAAGAASLLSIGFCGWGQSLGPLVALALAIVTFFLILYHPMFVPGLLMQIPLPPIPQGHL
jgi:hypothetical protein